MATRSDQADTAFKRSLCLPILANTTKPDTRAFCYTPTLCHPLTNRQRALMKKYFIAILKTYYLLTIGQQTTFIYLCISTLNLLNTKDMDTNLLNLFDTIKTKPTDLVPDKDMNQIQSLWKKFMERFNDLLKIHSNFCELDEKNIGDTYKFGSRDYVNSPRWSNELDNRLQTYSYTYKYDILNCEKLMQRICNVIESYIVDYFNNTYSCSLTSNTKLSESLFDEKSNRYNNTLPQLQIILDDIIRQNEGMSFSEKGIYDSTLSFGQNVRYSEITLSGKTVNISRMVEMRGYGSVELCYSSWENVYNLLSAIAFCLYQSSGLFHILRHQDVDYLQHMNVGNALCPESKLVLEQIKYFKNGKLSIKFSASETANKFYAFLNEAKSMAKK